MRVVAMILALAAGASGCPCSTAEYEQQCTNCGCKWQDQCEGGRRNLRFGAAATGCCTTDCRRRLTEEEMAALSAGQLEERRLSC